jgi:hypothetical protein
MVAGDEILVIGFADTGSAARDAGQNAMFLIPARVGARNQIADLKSHGAVLELIMLFSRCVARRDAVQCAASCLREGGGQCTFSHITRQAGRRRFPRALRSAYPLPWRTAKADIRLRLPKLNSPHSIAAFSTVSASYAPAHGKMIARDGSYEATLDRGCASVKESACRSKSALLLACAQTSHVALELPEFNIMAVN